jgi:hypothetical protein
MGFFSAIKSFFMGSDDPAALADEVERYADRFENAGDSENAALARGYARRIRNAADAREARRLYDEFKAAVRDEDEGERHLAADRHREHDDDTWSDDS